MSLAAALRATAAFAHPPSLEQVGRDLDPAWITAALTATGTATLRRRRLPAEHVLGLVLGMALFRDRSIVEVAARLDLALPGPRGPTAAPSAVSQARARLGPEPLAWLFAQSAAHWAPSSADAHRWRGLALYGLDGTTLRVPDSAANRAHFGGPASGRGASGYPQLRLVALLVLRSHPISCTPSPSGPPRPTSASMRRPSGPRCPTTRSRSWTATSSVRRTCSPSPASATSATG